MHYPCLLTVKEAAWGLRIAPATLRRQIRLGVVPAVRIGRILRLRDDDLERLLKTYNGNNITELRGYSPPNPDSREPAVHLRVLKP